MVKIPDGFYEKFFQAHAGRPGVLSNRKDRDIAGEQSRLYHKAILMRSGRLCLGQ